MPARSSPETLSRRALNRATLARQMLLQRARVSPLQAIRRLVGMQAQAPNPPYIALWTRLEGFSAPRLTRLIERGAVLRGALMRSTLFLVAAGEHAELRRVLQPALTRSLQATHGRALQGLALDAVLARGRALLAESARTHGELGRELQRHWPACDPNALASVLRNLAPLIHLPPAGTWDSHAHARLSVAADAGASSETSAALQTLAWRYLGAFGPASVADMAAWCGLAGLRTVFDTLRPRLRAFRDERGRELFDLPRAPRPAANTPVAPRLLGEWDNLLLSHDDRSRILDEADRMRVFSVNGLVRGTALRDGFVAGVWTLQRGRAAAVLDLSTFGRWPAVQRAALHAEGLALLAFAAPGARAQVRIRVGD